MFVQISQNNKKHIFQKIKKLIFRRHWCRYLFVRLFEVVSFLFDVRRRRHEDLSFSWNVDGRVRRHSMDSHDLIRSLPKFYWDKSFV